MLNPVCFCCVSGCVSISVRLCLKSKSTSYRLLYVFPFVLSCFARIVLGPVDLIANSSFVRKIYLEQIVYTLESQVMYTYE